MSGDANKMRMDSSALLLMEYLHNVEAAELNRQKREVAMLAMMIDAHNASEDIRLTINIEETKCER